MSNIILNNQEFKLKFDVNAICYIEEKAGKGIMALLDFNNLGFNIIRLLVAGGIKHQMHNVHPEIVGTWLQESLNQGEDFNSLFEKCSIALQESGVLGKEKSNESAKIEGEIKPTES